MQHGFIKGYAKLTTYLSDRKTGLLDKDKRVAIIYLDFNKGDLILAS